MVIGRWKDGSRSAALCVLVAGTVVSFEAPVRRWLSGETLALDLVGPLERRFAAQVERMRAARRILWLGAEGPEAAVLEPLLDRYAEALAGRLFEGAPSTAPAGLDPHLLDVLADAVEAAYRDGWLSGRPRNRETLSSAFRFLVGVALHAETRKALQFVVAPALLVDRPGADLAVGRFERPGAWREHPLGARLDRPRSLGDGWYLFEVRG